MKRSSLPRRRGIAVALLFIALLPIMAFAALAVDLGLMTIARTQCQNAADTAAMVGARTLNGDSANNNNYSAVAGNCQTSVGQNKVLSNALAADNISLQIGRYTYNTSTQQFEGLVPGPSTENWSMVRATVTSNVQNSMGFSKTLNVSIPNIQAAATAAHRPRDVAVILDFSGSMRFASLQGVNWNSPSSPYANSRTDSHNGDSVYPIFGHYSSSSAQLQETDFPAPFIEPNITTTTSDGRAPIVQDFFTSASGNPPPSAFSAAASSYGSTPGGDNFLKQLKNTSSSWAQQVQQILSPSVSTGSITNSYWNSNWESTSMTAGSNLGYKWATGSTFNRYTEGPGYWGKTFWVWPPDPLPCNNGAGDPAPPYNDWRIRYFTYPGLAAGVADNSDLYDSSGNWKAPSSTGYQINYNAILYWLKNIGPNPFPSRLQAGRILYYDSIPDTINTASWPPSDMNQRFWKDYIDWCLGVVQTSSGSNGYTLLNGGSTAYTGYGPDYTWGTVRITAYSSLTNGYANGGSSGAQKKPYMHYLDNPKRPKLKFWFGPLSMIDFLGNYNAWSQTGGSYASRFAWWPGTCHESPMYALKLGIRAAINDINNNHPNDLVSLIFFSVPLNSTSDTQGHRFNRVRVPLGKSYTQMIDSLWYPPSTVMGSATTIRPYDADNTEVPRAMGGTCYSHPLMLAYNQFSMNSSLRSFNPAGPSGDAGGNGRRGAQKIVIFETDGAPTTTATATLNNSGAYQSYYRVRCNSSSSNMSGSDFPSTTDYSANASAVVSQIQSLCTQLAALDTASPPGYSTPTKPLQIHCIAFGPEFAPSGPNYNTNLNTLKSMQQRGNITDNMPSYKIIYGTESQVVSKLQQAFTKILQSGVQVSLIE